jgi:DNA-directed RNA polymerase sigma subunit (sigma70/sigma32)
LPKGALCVLDVAAEGEHSLEDIAALLGDCTKSRVGQILHEALKKLREREDVAALAEILDPGDG